MTDARLISLIRADIRRSDEAAWRTVLGFLILDPLVAVLLYRLSHAAYGNRLTAPLAWLLKALSGVLFATDIHPGAVIGPGLFLAHPGGVVIGSGVVAGADLKLESRVVIGGDEDGRMPTIGRGVTVHSGACVIGPNLLGDFSVVGANAVVLCDVPAYWRAVGVPARCSPRHGREV